MDDFFKYIFLLSAFQGMTLFVLLFIKRKKENKYLAVILLKFSILHLINFISIVESKSLLIPFLGLFLVPFVEGPCIYLYLKRALSTAKDDAISLLHFIPAIIFGLTWFVDIKYRKDIFEIIIRASAALWNLLYLIKTVRLIRKIDSKGDKTRFFLWICSLNLLLFGAGVLPAFDLFFELSGIDRISNFISDATFLFEILIIFVPSWILLYFPSVADISYKKTAYYSNSRLEQAELDAYFERIKDVAEKEEFFTNSESNMRLLSDETGISPNIISQVINRKAKCNFSSYLSNLRIEKACVLLKESESTILDIAFESGFSSKSAFNLAFKNNQKVTPSEYKKATL